MVQPSPFDRFSPEPPDEPRHWIRPALLIIVAIAGALVIFYGCTHTVADLNHPKHGVDASVGECITGGPEARDTEVVDCASREAVYKVIAIVYPPDETCPTTGLTATISIWGDMQRGTLFCLTDA